MSQVAPNTTLTLLLILDAGAPRLTERLGPMHEWRILLVESAKFFDGGVFSQGVPLLDIFRGREAHLYDLRQEIATTLERCLLFADICLLDGSNTFFLLAYASLL